MLARKKIYAIATLTISFVIMLILVGVLWGGLASAGTVTLPWESPPNFRVVYLVANTTLPAVRRQAPTLLKNSLNAETVHSWQSVLDADQAKELDALVIDKSALPLLNQGDLRRIYRNGAVIAAFDVPAAKLSELLNDPCITEDNFGLEPYSGSSFFVSVSHRITGEPQDVALIQSTKPCGGMVEGVKRVAGVTITKQTDNLLTENDYNVFARVLVAQMQTVDAP